MKFALFVESIHLKKMIALRYVLFAVRKMMVYSVMTPIIPKAQTV